MKQLLIWNYVDENKFGLNLFPNNQKFKSQLLIIFFFQRDDITNVTEHEIHSRFFDLFPGQTYWHTFETALTGSQSKLFETEIKNLQAINQIKVHAFPFYKKCSYKKRPIKFFNHKKQQPIEFFKIRNWFFFINN